MNFSISDKKIGFIGMGNMGQAILRGLMTSHTMAADQVYVTNRTPGKVDKVVKKWGCTKVATNEELIELVDIVVLGTKPQDLLELLESVRGSFNEDKVVVSLAAGIDTRLLRKYIPQGALVRVMPNTPIFVCSGVIGFCLPRPDVIVEKIVQKLFSPLGLVVSMDEGEAFRAFTVASSSGTGFVLELMQYWQDWLHEYGISQEEARKIVVETFLGTAELAKKESEQSFHALVDKVASKKGVTAAGLQSIRELELEGILRMSFNKSFMRDEELGKES